MEPLGPTTNDERYDRRMAEQILSFPTQLGRVMKITWVPREYPLDKTAGVLLCLPKADVPSHEISTASTTGRHLSNRVCLLFL